MNRRIVTTQIKSAIKKIDFTVGDIKQIISEANDDDIFMFQEIGTDSKVSPEYHNSYIIGVYRTGPESDEAFNERMSLINNKLDESRAIFNGFKEE